MRGAGDDSTRTLTESGRRRRRRRRGSRRLRRQRQRQKPGRGGRRSCSSGGKQGLRTRTIWAALSIGGVRWARRAGPGMECRRCTVVHASVPVQVVPITEAPPGCALGRKVCNSDSAAGGPRHGKDLVRIGEATNPGPHDRPQQPEGLLPLEFGSRHQDGFWEGILPGDVQRDQGNMEVHAAAADRYQLAVETCNGTSWGSIARYLARTSADLILIQEHHLSPQRTAAASSWAARRGWQTIWAPAEAGDGEGWRAGVCICAREPVSLSVPRSAGTMVHGSRAVAALAEAPGYRPITVYSAYLHDGDGLSGRNLGILADIGRHIVRQGAQAPFIVGADFQVEPRAIAAAGWVDKLHAVVVASGCRRGTCRTAKSRSELDFSTSNRGWPEGSRAWRPSRPPASGRMSQCACPFIRGLLVLVRW